GGEKPVVVSMGGLAASGGYYIAMPADHIFGEPTTHTGSIGVIAGLLNVAEFSKKYGVTMNVIKAGAIKDSGSMFKEMTPEERIVWQVMVDHSYARFKKLVEEGRGNKLKYKLQQEIVKEFPEVDNRGKPVLDQNGKQKTVKYVRQLADGGIFM